MISPERRLLVEAACLLEEERHDGLEDALCGFGRAQEDDQLLCARSGWEHCPGRADGGQVKVAHSAMLQAIVASKRKNDRIDARKISDLLRCDYFPQCHMVGREWRDRRRVLRYRNLMVRQNVRMKNRVSSLLMESGVAYNKKKLHQKRYFAALLAETQPQMPESLPQLLQLSRGSIEFLSGMD